MIKSIPKNSHRNKVIVRVNILYTLLLFTATVHAVELSNISFKDERIVKIAKVKFVQSGSVKIKENVLETMMFPLVSTINKEGITKKQIIDLTKNMSQEARKNGYLIAQVVVTNTDFMNALMTGELTFTFIPGQVGRINIENSSNVSNERLLHTLASALCKKFDTNNTCAASSPLDAAQLERATLNVSDIPGIGAEFISFSSANVAAGETEVTFKIKSNNEKNSVMVGLDNYGTVSTGRTRGGITSSFTNLLHQGDVTQLSLLATNKSLYTGALEFSSPIGYSGFRGVFDVSRLNYSVADVITKGIADNLSIGLSYPLIRSLHDNVRAELDCFYTESKSDLNGATITHSRLSGSRLSLKGDDINSIAPVFGQNYYQWYASLTHGGITIDDSAQAAADSSTAKIAGQYNKFQYGFVGRHNLISSAQGAYAQVNLRGQSAWKNLDGSEKLAMGGPAASRAYMVDNALVDVGTIASLDIRQPFRVWERSVVPGIFYDYAKGYINHNPWDASVNNTILRRGYGASLEITPTSQSVLDISVAHALDDYQRYPNNTEFWMSFGIKFW